MQISIAVLALGFSVFFSESITFAETSIPKCMADEHWVRAHRRKAYVRADGVWFSATNITAHCRGNPPHFLTLEKSLKPGVPPDWQYPKEKSKNWTEEEKERVFEALSALPELLLSTGSNFYRLTQSNKYHLNPAAGHANEIALYDRAFDSNENLARIVAHELAHKVYRQLPAEEARSYNLVADWILTRTPNGNTIFVPIRDNFSEEDGKDGPDEDFSNNFEHYLFNNAELKAKNQKIHEWIHKKFGANLKLGKVSQ